jgi:hypothetical protein
MSTKNTIAKLKTKNKGRVTGSFLTQGNTIEVHIGTEVPDFSINGSETCATEAALPHTEILKSVLLCSQREPNLVYAGLCAERLCQC